MNAGKTYSLAEIAAAVDADVIGDTQVSVTGLQTLAAASEHELSFLANPRYRSQLQQTRAAAVLLRATDVDDCPVVALVVDDPYLAYARLSAWFDDRPQRVAGIHPTAIVDPTAKVADSATIAAYAQVGAHAEIADGVEIGAHVVINDYCRVGQDSRLADQVTLYHNVHIGARALIHSGAVIGSDGFGFASSGGRWHKITQLGGVRIGDDVEIGAGTTIDRGALESTRIGNGVKLDNQIQIAHNVEVGDDCAFAGCVAVAGSSRIGRRCTLAGGSAVVGHVQLVDDVHVTAMCLVTKSITEPGVYSSGTGMQPNQQWKRNVVRFRQLDQMAGRLSEVEKAIAAIEQQSSEHQSKG